MRVVIDANIIFSALLHPQGREFSAIAFGGLDLYACQFCTVELFHHKGKLLRYSRLSERELLDNY